MHWFCLVVNCLHQLQKVLQDNPNGIVMDELLTITQVAETLSVSRHTISRMLQDTTRPGINVGNGKVPRWRIERLAVDEFLASRRSGKQAAPRKRRNKLPPVPEVV